jgi:hypothetical protein
MPVVVRASNGSGERILEAQTAIASPKYVGNSNIQGYFPESDFRCEESSASG